MERDEWKNLGLSNVDGAEADATTKAANVPPESTTTSANLPPAKK